MNVTWFLRCTLIGISINSLPLFAQESPESARHLVDKWAETRRLISRETSDWRTERVILEETLTLLTQEADRLASALVESETASISADEETGELSRRKEKLAEASAVLESRIGDLEQRIQKLIQRFPSVLVTRIDPLIRRIPEQAETTGHSLAERMQTVVGILSQADKFNRTLVQTSEARVLEDGREVEVRTLYWGLAMAYFVDSTGNYGGIGFPTPDGQWEWAHKQQSGPLIARIIDMYEGGAEIEFLELPTRIQELSSQD